MSTDGLRFQVTPPTSAWRRLKLQARAWISSRTDILSGCSGVQGSPSFGAIADLILDAGGAEPIRKRWYFFSSVHGGAVVPNGVVIRELRAALHVGVFVPVKFGGYTMGLFRVLVRR